MASTYLYRTPTTQTIDKYTMSFWVKRSGLGSTQRIYSHHQTNYMWCRFESSDQFRFTQVVSGNETTLRTDRVFRDASAWYHFVITFDTTQSTEADRIKLWVNGVQETSFNLSTYPSQDATVEAFNSGTPFEISRYSVDNTEFLDGSLAHCHMTVAYAYPASTFGETDSTSGIWKPKIAPSVTYGTNGFFLKFQDSSSLGDDSSGNTNDFTLSGNGRQILDTPSNVFATWNTLNQNLSYPASLAYGNTDIDSQNNTGQFQNTSTFGVSQGKWYMEIKSKSNGQNCFGITSNPGFHALNNYYIGQTSFSWGYVEANGNKINNDSTVQSGNSFTSGDIIGIAMDLDNSKLFFSKNGTWENSADPVAGTGGLSITANETYFFGCSDVTGSTSAKSSANFGNGYFQATAVSSAENDDAGYGKFEYDVPTGYYALCTKNINTYG